MLNSCDNAAFVTFCSDWWISFNKRILLIQLILIVTLMVITLTKKQMTYGEYEDDCLL